MATRNPRLAKLHIGRKELGLDEASYRGILERITGSSSAAACGDQQLDAMLTEFRRLGWTPRSAAPRSRNPQVRLIYGLWAEMAPQLGSGGTRAALRAFVRRQTGKEAPEFLDPAQANLVVEGLKAWGKRLRAGERA